MIVIVFDFERGFLRGDVYHVGIRKPIVIIKVGHLNR